jgi:hypothetical protein
VSLRKIVLALLIANLGYFAYSQGWLGFVLDNVASQREPERMNRQINPNAIVVTATAKPPPTAAVAVATAPSESEPLPAVEICTSRREQWLVYMGPYASKALVDKKKAELAALRLASTPVSKPTLKLGLSLGQFDSEASARDALAGFVRKGVKTATIVLWGTTSCS